MNIINRKRETVMIIGKFVINRINYVTVRLENSAHVMTEAEWRKICRKKACEGRQDDENGEYGKSIRYERK